MDQEKKIRALLSENEFLQLQLEDLNASIKTKEEEISFLADDMDTASSLQSQIAGNLAEIEQLRYNMSLSEQKNAGAEILNAELENELLKEIREKHKEQAANKKLGSVQTELEIISNELDEAVPLNKKVEDLENELAEAKSMNAILEDENISLKQELAELNELLRVLKKKKFD